MMTKLLTMYAQLIQLYRENTQINGKKAGIKPFFTTTTNILIKINMEKKLFNQDQESLGSI